MSSNRVPITTMKKSKQHSLMRIDSRALDLLGTGASGGRRKSSDSGHPSLGHVTNGKTIPPIIEPGHRRKLSFSDAANMAVTDTQPRKRSLVAAQGGDADVNEVLRACAKCISPTGRNKRQSTDRLCVPDFHDARWEARLHSQHWLYV